MDTEMIDEAQANPPRLKKTNRHLKGIERRLQVIAARATREAQQEQAFKEVLTAKVALLEDKLNEFCRHQEASQASHEVRRQRFEQDTYCLRKALDDVQRLLNASGLAGLRAEMIERLWAKLTAYSEHCEAAMTKADSGPKEVGQVKHLMETLTQDLMQLEGL